VSVSIVVLGFLISEILKANCPPAKFDESNPFLTVKRNPPLDIVVNLHETSSEKPKVLIQVF
jgi:hypothetical protein